MSSPKQPETGDDIQIEVSDVRDGADAASPAPSRSLFEPRYTRRQQVARLAAGLLALVVVVGGITGVGGRAIEQLVAPRSIPTPTLIPSLGGAPNFPSISPPPASTAVPAANSFYLLPNPPGVEVSLDGHKLASPPAPGDPHPLQLADGHHVLTWTSRFFPFPPLRCTISAPHASGDTCPFVNPQDLPAANADLAGHVIAMHDSLGALPRGAAGQLIQAVQAELDASSSQVIIQPGERYFFYRQGENGGPIAATQPLRATLSYVYLPDAGYFEPCILTQPAIPC